MLASRQSYQQSQALYERLIRSNPHDTELRLKLAEITLWSRNYHDALDQFQALWDSGHRGNDVIKGYIDAASSAESVDQKRRPTVLAMYDRVMLGAADDPVHLARMAWVLQKLSEYDKGSLLLERAMALKPGDRKVRQQFAGVLASMGRWQDAIAQLQIDPDIDSRYQIVGIYLMDQKFQSAEKECRAILEKEPKDPRARRLLGEILTWRKEYQDALQVLEPLAREFPDDVELAGRIAQVMLWAGDFEEALRRFERIAERVPEQQQWWSGLIDAAAGVKELNAGQKLMLRRVLPGMVGRASDLTLLIRSSWVAYQIGADAEAVQFLDQSVAVPMKSAAQRRELASVLAAVGRPRDAIAQYEGLSLDSRDRGQLLNLYSAVKDYSAAEAQCRALLRLNPADRQREGELIDLLIWQRRYPEAIALLEPLVAQAPNDKKLVRKFADTLLAGGIPVRALNRYLELLDERLEPVSLWLSIVDAAAAAPKLTDEQERVLSRLADQPEALGSADIRLVSRLAWVLHRMGDKERCQRFLDRALALKPKAPEAISELAGVLATAGRSSEALRLYETLPAAEVDTYRLAELYAVERRFAEAEKRCRELLVARPNDLRAQKLMALIHVHKQEFTEALALFEELLSTTPEDREIPIRIAECQLAAGAYDKALARYSVLLDREFDQPLLWPGFVDAAAGADELDDKQLRLAKKIADRSGQSGGVEMLTRLAWCLVKNGAGEQAAPLLDRAVSLRPRSHAQRRELAGVLAKAGRTRDAIAMYEGVKLTSTDRLNLGALLCTEKKYVAAEKQANLVLETEPNNLSAKRLLIDAYCGSGNYGRALPLLNEVKTEDLAPRRAAVLLALAMYAEALDEFTRLLDRDMDQVMLWPGFINAAARSEVLSETQRRIALELARLLPDAKDPPSESLMRLALIMHHLNKERERDDLLELVARAKIEDPAHKRELAGIAALAGRTNWAIELYESMPLRIDDRFLLAGLYITANRLEDAERQTREIIKAKPDNERGQRLLAEVLVARKEYRRAEQLIAQLLERHPKDTGLQLRWAETALALGDHAEALARYERMLDADFDQPKLWGAFINAASGVETLSASQEKFAKQISTQWSESAPADSQLRSRLAWILLRLGDVESAKRWVDQALALKPRDPAARRELAGVLAGLGRNREALAMFEGLELDNKDRLRLVGIHAALKDFAAAESECRAVLMSAPNDLPARLYLADLMFWQKKYKEAEALYKQLEGIAPRDAAIARKLAELALASGDYRLALERYQDLLDANADQRDLWVGFIDAAAGVEKLSAAQTKIAVHIFDRLDRNLWENTTFLSRLAWVLRKGGSLRKSVAMLNKVVDQEPKNREARLQLAETLAELGEHDEAEKHFRILLRSRSGTSKEISSLP